MQQGIDSLPERGEEMKRGKGERYLLRMDIARDKDTERGKCRFAGKKCWYVWLEKRSERARVSGWSQVSSSLLLIPRYVVSCMQILPIRKIVLLLDFPENFPHSWIFACFLCSSSPLNYSSNVDSLFVSHLEPPSPRKPPYICPAMAGLPCRWSRWS